MSCIITAIGDQRVNRLLEKDIAQRERFYYLELMLLHASFMLFEMYEPVDVLLTIF